MRKPLCIFSDAEELGQGLFGGMFYYLLQLLPYLHEEGIYPRWELRTSHYGDPPDFLTLPGVLDLAYTPPEGPCHRLTVSEMRRRHAHVVGNDWGALHALWIGYFRIPERTSRAAEGVLPAGKVLGIHYRGTDKQTATWDSNPISAEQYLFLIREFMGQRPDFTSIFVATDEFSFVERLRRSVSLPVLSMGEVEFHMAAEHRTTRAAKADRALLDCVLLSGCACVLETSSALPSFAKLLNPELEIYRCAASKLFGQLYTKMPYFPVAHIPVLPAHSPEARAILQDTLRDDWTGRAETAQYRQPFTAIPRWTRNHRLFAWAERVGIDKFVGRLLRGYR